MNPFRPPFGVSSRPCKPNTYRPNTTQLQPNFNLQEMDPNVFAYAQILASGGSQPFFQVLQTFPTMGGSQPSTQDTNPEIETVPETQPEPVVEGSKCGKRSHKKKAPTAPRRQENYQAWTKDEEYALARVWLDISEAPDVGLPTHSGQLGKRPKRCFMYLICWELLRGSPKWSNVPTMTSSSRRKSKRSKTSSSIDQDTPTSDARNVDLNIILDDNEDLELERPPGRRSAKNKGKKVESSSSNPERFKQDIEEMNQHLQDIRDLGHRRLQTMEERNAENKKFVAIQESRQMEKDIECWSKPINYLTGDALILGQMRQQQIRQKYGL
ncbi:putative No apical meristem-associated domain-containing protein [Helianthus annuus]|nr:putative No apical meristem-associated domain-containing protein [Helianthus annuus]